MSFERETEEAVSLLKTLIAIQSTSRNETAAADALQREIELRGYRSGRKDNNIWIMGPAMETSKPTLLLNAHIDTVKPVAGWSTETRAFSASAASDGIPRWADFADPLDAIGARAADIKRRAADHTAMARFTPKEREALSAMGLGGDTDRSSLRRRYSELVRRYHPDRNGGDRTHEKALGKVIEAYTQLKARPAFA